MCILMNIWMVRKNSMKLHYLKKVFTVTYEDITDEVYAHAKRLCKYFEIKFFG